MTTLEKLKALKEQQLTANNTRLEMLAESEKEDRGELRGKFNADEQTKWESLSNDLDKIEDNIRKYQDVLRAEEEQRKLVEWLDEPEPPPHRAQPGEHAMPDKRDGGEGNGKPEHPTDRAEYRKAFRNYVLGGFGEMPSPERRALQAGEDTIGGYIVPPMQWMNRLIKAVDNNVFVRRFATVIPVTGADSLGAPSLDTDPADPTWTSEIKTGSEDSSLTFGGRKLTPHPIAQRIKISETLLRKAALDPEMLVADRMAYKFSVVEESAFLLGSGSGQPLGIFTDSTIGVPAASCDVVTGSDTDFTADGLITAATSMKSQYWARARWVFHRVAIRKIRQLKHGDGTYLWTPGLGNLVGATILDMPYDVSEYCPYTFTSGLYVGALCDWSQYWIADAMTYRVKRLVELYAESDQVGFIARKETDGMPVLSEAFIRLKTGT